MPLEVLLIDDNPGDADLAREALGEGRPANKLHVVSDGLQALAYLRKDGKYKGAVRPDLILLDLNMPRVSGQEVLAQIKADPGLMRIPVVVLTTSRAERDILESYNLRANCYVAKPVDFDQFIHVIRSICDFWLTVVTLPPD
ncbi:MAG: response regulator [Capsulimonadaceae bacterium]